MKEEHEFSSVPRLGGKYELLQRLGSGGMGVVYKAFDSQLKRHVALKFLKEELTIQEDAKTRLLVEAQAAAALDHANICVIYESGETKDGQLYFSMPFYEGETLREKLSSHHLATEKALEYIRQTAKGLACAHAAHIVHRDIKPANLLVTQEDIVKILDFGIAKRTQDHLTSDGSRLGTLAYMSPEQLQNDHIDQRTDVWALGIVLFELLTGKRPFQGEYEYALMYSLLHEDPIPVRSLNQDIPLYIEAAIKKALSKKKEDRFHTVEELLLALDPPEPNSTSTGVKQTELAHPERLPRFSTEGERIQATVVVTGISGYFDLIEEITSTELSRKLKQLEEQFLDILAQHHGCLYQFSGEEIILLFGILESQEDDGLRAIQALQILHQMVSDREDNLSLQSAVASGSLVARGLADSSSFEVSGKIMNIVRRMAARAEEDTILLDVETARLIRSHYETSEYGSLPSRKEGTNHLIYRLEAQREQVSPVHGDIEQGLTVFTGRQREMDMIQRCFNRALHSEGQFVTLNGEAGLGKSRLSYEFRSSLKDQDITLLMGRCQSYSSHTPFVPFIEVLRAVFGIESIQATDIDVDHVVASIIEIDEQLQGMIPLYLHLLGLTHTTYSLPENVEGPTLRRAINESFSALFIALSQQRPLVLVLDDWHWSDEGSRDVLKKWIELLGPYRVLVLLTYRPALVPDWGHPECHTSIRLRPLEVEHVDTMMRGLLNVSTIPESVTSILIERTEGNPFFLEELINSMLEENVFSVRHQQLYIQGAIDRTSIPGSVQAVLRTRIERLPESAKAILLTASVIGRTFVESVLQEVLPNEVTLHEDLDTLRKKGLIQQTRVLPNTEYRFKHALIQEVSYTNLLTHQRKRLHEQVGMALEKIFPSMTEEQPFRLMNHFKEAEKWEKAISYAEKAAEMGNHTFHYNETIKANNLILSWTPYLKNAEAARMIKIKALQRKDKLFETLFHNQDRKKGLEVLFSSIYHESEKALSCDYYIRKADSLIEEHQVEEAYSTLEKALTLAERIGDQKLVRRVIRSKGWLYWIMGNDIEARKISEKILEAQRKEGDTSEIFGTLLNLSSLESRHGNYENTRAYIEEALSYLSDDNLTLDHATALYYLGRIESMQGNYDKAEKVMNHAIQAWESFLSQKVNYSILKLQPTVPHMLTEMGNIKLAQQKYDEAEHHYRKYLQFQESITGRKNEHVGILLVLGNFLLGRGRLTEAIEQLEEAYALIEKHHIRIDITNVCLSLAIAYEQQENYPGAYVYWEKLQTNASDYHEEENLLKALEGKVRVARLQHRDPSMLIELQKDVLEYAVSHGLKEKQADVYNTLGILEWNRNHITDALAYFQAGFDLFVELHDPIHAGLMLNSIGAAQVKLGQTEEAMATFQQALEHHEHNGQKLLKGHALAALGDIERNNKHFDQAIAYYGESLALRWDIDDRPGEGWMLERIAKIHILQGEPEKARKELRKALEIAEECGDTKLLTTCQKALATPH